MHRVFWLAVAVLTGIVVLAGAAAAQESPAPTVAASPGPVIAWPGTRASPEGIRAWTPRQSPSWMHKVPDDGADVELSFEVVPEPFKVPRRPAGLRAQMWLMDLDGRTVVITVKSTSDTPPELLAEAEAVVESVRVDLDGPTGPRLLFDLTEGWDIG